MYYYYFYYYYYLSRLNTLRQVFAAGAGDVSKLYKRRACESTGTRSPTPKQPSTMAS